MIFFGYIAGVARKIRRGFHLFFFWLFLLWPIVGYGLEGSSFHENQEQTKREHLVRPGQTLSEIALKHGISVEFLRKLNRLPDDQIQAGKTLRLPRQAFPDEKYQIRRGDTLSYIAMLYDIKISALQKANSLSEGDLLRKSSWLNLPYQAEESESSSTQERPSLTEREQVEREHRVRLGQTLSEIALKYGLSVESLRKLNRLSDDQIRAGESLRLPRKALSNEKYQVQRGDTLSYIAMLYGVKVLALQRTNSLNSTSLLREGKWLHLPYQSEELRSFEPASFSPRMPTVAPGYFFYATSASTQMAENYSEEKLKDFQESFFQAQRVLDRFKREVDQRPPLGKILEGFYIVIDPGHGGLDPGAIVPLRQGGPYVVEDEYAYDISLRLYDLLTRLGAQVILTILSPNHHIRYSGDSDRTFVNQKNELYNLNYLPKEEGWTWPVGTRTGLQKRLEIARAYFFQIPQGVPPERKLFLSVHNDITPGIPSGMTVLYRKGSTYSRRLAEQITEQGGEDTTARTQIIYVLEGAEDWMGILVEVRNLVYQENRQAILSDIQRQKDAQIIADGLVSYSLSLREL